MLWGSNIILEVGDMLSRSPLARVKVLLSSKTEFKFSIQIESTGPSSTNQQCSPEMLFTKVKTEINGCWYECEFYVVDGGGKRWGGKIFKPSWTAFPESFPSIKSVCNCYLLLYGFKYILVDVRQYLSSFWVIFSTERRRFHLSNHL